MDTRSAEKATAGVFGADTSRSVTSAVDDEDAHDDTAAASLDIAATGSMHVDRANQTGCSLALVAKAMLGNWRPPSPHGAERSHPASARTVKGSNISVVGALSNAAKLALPAAIISRAGAVLALRFASAKCSQMLTLLRGRSHDNRSAYLHVVSTADDIASVERNEDMHGS